MDIQLLETFLDLMETKSFNKTADRLGITQSTVSHRVRSLESLLGKRLFNRSRAGTLPTIAGTRFLDHARILCQEWREAIRHVETTRAFEKVMRLGVQHDVAGGFSGPAVNEMRRKLPRVSIFLQVDYSLNIIRSLLSGELDIGLVFTPQHQPDLYFEPLGNIQYQMVSNHVALLGQVVAEHYILLNLSPDFNDRHRMALPNLTDTPLTCGTSRAVENLLGSISASSYVSEYLATKMGLEINCRTIIDAPIFDQPVYAAVHVRNRHVHSHLQIINIFRALLPGILDPQA
ncbi:MAG: LysR family transcriptional regulator [Hyphomicrobiales bacterium]